MANRLSHSAIQRFLMCNESYRLHYIEKLRPTTASSPLIFGVAFDEGITALLEGKTEEEAENTFEQYLKCQEINGVETDLRTCTEVLYSNGDMDADILTENDVEALKAQATRSGLPGYTDHLSAYQEIKEKKGLVGFKNLAKEEKEFYNLASWLSLYRKGLLMIEAYKTQVMPLLTKVHETQKEIRLENADGDVLIGKVDLIADVKGHGTVILDNKTASRAYAADSVRKSEQLSLYLHAVEDEYKTRKAGYIVLPKNVAKIKTKVCDKCGHTREGGAHATCDNVVDKKRCGGNWTITTRPQINVQFIVDEISEGKEAEIINAADEVNEKISRGEFHRNERQCHNWYGSRCVYFDYCHGGSMKDLIKKEDKDGK